MTTNQSRREIIRRKQLEQKRRKTITLVLIGSGIVILITLVAVIPNLLGRKSYDIQSQGLTLGNPDAPIHVVNFSSYTCSFCSQFSYTAEPEFIQRYVETGDVYYRFVNLAFSNDEGTQNAAKASYCAADQNRFYDLKPDLYASATVQNGFSTSNLVKLAADTGLDGDAFEACINSDTYNDAIIADLRFAQSVGLTGTPSFLVNDQLVYANELFSLVDSLLDQ